MSSDKFLRVVCPTCKTVMKVDKETGIVIHRTVEKERPSLDDLLHKEAAKDNTDRFAEAFKKEKERKAKIEEKYKAALENIDELEDPINPLDLD